MTTVACVLKAGGDFGPEYVHALKRGLDRCMPAGSCEFAVLTDVAGLPGGRPLKYGWKGWWSKLELFRPGAFTGRVLYMDLDTLIVGDLGDLCSYEGEFAGIRSLMHGKGGKLQSGVMAWTPGPVTWALWEAFTRNPAASMKARGDGEWIAAHVEKADRLNDLYPGQIVSTKVEAKKGIPPNARLVCLHGRPRPHEARAGWAHQQWRK